jgi:hypothetical protein
MTAPTARYKPRPVPALAFRRHSRVGNGDRGRCRPPRPYIIADLAVEARNTERFARSFADDLDILVPC